MNWWVKVKCISVSAVIAKTMKTASRSVAFEAMRVKDSIMVGQDKFIMRQTDDAEVGLRIDCEEDLVDAGNNADLYVANQENTELTSEVHTEDIPLSSMGQDLFHLQPLSLD